MNNDNQANEALKDHWLNEKVLVRLAMLLGIDVLIIEDMERSSLDSPFQLRPY